MSVRFQGNTEYDERFKKFTSHKSASFVPEMEQALPPAGRTTLSVAPKTEPAIQQKKRIAVAPGSSLNSDFFTKGDNSEDYVLLGNQDKFTTNVKYWNKGAPNRDVSPPKIQKIYSEPSRELSHTKVIPPESRKPVITPLAPRKEKLSSVADINKNDGSVGKSGAASLKADKIKKILEEERNKQTYDVGKKLNFEQKSAKNDNYKIVRPDTEGNIENRAERKITLKNAEMERLKRYSEINKENLRETRPKKPVKDYRKATFGVAKPQIVPKAVATEENKPLEMDENANSNENYALKYKAGIAKSGKGPKRQSEYQREYEWKTGVKCSPLIDAVQMVHGGQSDAPNTHAMFNDTEYSRQYKAPKWIPLPTKSRDDVMDRLVPVERHEDESDPVSVADRSKKYVARHRVSEYSWQYKAPKWIPLPTKSRDDAMDRLVPVERHDDESAPVTVADRSKKPKRSKSVGAHDRAAGMPSGLTKGDDSDRVTEALDVHLPVDLEEKMEKLRKKHRHLTSEYDSNYQSPCAYQYQQGVWKGGKSPPKYECDHEQKQPTDSSRSWFAEVLELREKAAEYRKRAEGTHFSRDHLVQLLAKQARLWEGGSSGSLTPDVADSIPNENETTEKTPAERKIPAPDLPRSVPAVNRRLLAWGSDDGGGQAENRLQNGWDSPKPLPTSHSSQESYPPENIVPANKGRVPTPELITSSSRRHHLDRTTPAVGGAILVSPKGNKSSSRRRIVKPCYMQQSHNAPLPKNQPDVAPHESDDDTIKEDSPRQLTPPSTPQRPPKLNLASLSPTFGSPSYDSHCLRDDDASTDRPLQTKYVQSPLKDVPPLNEPPKTEPTYKSRYLSQSKIDDSFSPPHRQADNLRQPDTMPDRAPLTQEWMRYHQKQLTQQNKASPNHQVEDDQISISAASSCSLASDVLERAQKRRDFWSNNRVQTR